MRNVEKNLKKLLSLILVLVLVFTTPTFNANYKTFANSIGTRSSVKKEVGTDIENDEEIYDEINYAEEKESDDILNEAESDFIDSEEIDDKVDGETTENDVDKLSDVDKTVGESDNNKEPNENAENNLIKNDNIDSETLNENSTVSDKVEKTNETKNKLESVDVDKNVNIKSTSENENIEKNVKKSEEVDSNVVSSKSNVSEEIVDDKNSEIENELDIISTNSEVVSHEKNDIASKEETNIKNSIATESVIEATTSEVINDYKKLSSYEQIIDNVSGAAELNGDTIKLIKDIELTKTIYFSEDMNLDLNGHTIIGPNDNSALHITNNFTLTDSSDSVGSIKGNGNDFPTIYIEEAKVTFERGIIYGADGKYVEDSSEEINGGTAVEVVDSNLTFSGAIINGGCGADADAGKGGNGGCGVVILSAKNNNMISITAGSISGGNGGGGIGEKNPSICSALRVNGKTYENKYFGKGLKGSIGGGNGGIALDIRTDKFKSKNLYYGEYTLNAGHAGFSKNQGSINESENNFTENKEVDELFGATAKNNYYSLYDLDGKNYLTSFKTQGATGLCVPFAVTAYAETALIKNYPDYVRNVLGKEVYTEHNRDMWTPNSNELNLSELQFGMQMFVQPKDEFGNAGLSKYADNVNYENNWAYLGADSSMIAKTATTWRTLVEEDAELMWPSTNATNLIQHRIDRNFLNNYTDKTVVHAKEAVIHSADEYCVGYEFDREGFISQLKKDIVEYTGVALSIFTGNRQQYATFPDGTHAYVSRDGLLYDSYVMGLGISSEFEKNETSELGWHTMYCIGWDDKVRFTDSLGEHEGAFICKNSWAQFSLVPFDTAWALYYKEDANDGNKHIPNYFMDYVAMKFVPAFTEYENIYFYDSGIGSEYIAQSEAQGVDTKNVVRSNVDTYGEVTYKMNLNYSSLVNTFEIRNDKEKVKAVNAYILEPGRYKITIYKVATLENENTLLNSLKDVNIKASEEMYLNKGMCLIPLSTDVDFVKNDKVAVKVERLDKEYFGKAEIDSIIDETYVEQDTYILKGTKYETVHKGRSFFTDLKVKMTETTSNGNTYHEGDSDFSSMMEMEGNTILDEVSNNNSNKIRKLDDGKNARIRLITNNYITLFANERGKFVDDLTETYVYPKLRSAIGNIIEPTPSATGDAFEIYNTKADGTGIDYDANSIYHMNIGKSLRLYAKWINATDFARMTFEPNGGEGEMVSLSRAKDTVIKIPSASYKKVGYVFDGWIDEGGNAVEVASDFTLSADTTLTAKWKENEFKITYELNDGKFIAGFNNYKVKRLYSEDVDLPDSSKVERVGYIFDGWYDNEDCVGDKVTKTNAINTEKELTYYIKWKPITYTVKYVTNGGNIAIQSFKKTYDVEAKGLLTPKKYLDKFLGWYVDEELTTKYNNRDLTTTDNDVKYIYAKWEHVKITIVKFETKYGTVPAEQYIEHNKKVVSPKFDNVVGFKFLYWYENDENVEFDFDKALSAEEETTITLKAKWERMTYDITLNVGNGKIDDENVTKYTYGVGAILPTNVISNDENYKFDGWYETSDFKGNKINEISKTDTGNKTYYARYVEVKKSNPTTNYTPSYGNTGGTGGSTGGGGGGAGAYVGGQLTQGLTPLTQNESAKMRDTTIEADMRSIPVNYNTTDSVWTSDEEGYKHLNLKVETGDMVEAKNLFACIKTPHVDAKGDTFEVEDFYYFDNEGKMYIGWLKDIDKTTYYFEATTGDENGKLARGWTKIEGDHYYFDGTGTLQTNTVTPDGFTVDANGRWVENNVKSGNADNTEKNTKVEASNIKVGVILSK